TILFFKPRIKGNALNDRGFLRGLIKPALKKAEKQYWTPQYNICIFLAVTLVSLSYRLQNWGRF
ncbi:MAG: hypothetical protein ACYS74_08955, partial [Planctomycetota bacterium]